MPLRYAVVSPGLLLLRSALWTVLTKAGNEIGKESNISPSHFRIFSQTIYAYGNIHTYFCDENSSLFEIVFQWMSRIQFIFIVQNTLFDFFSPSLVSGILGLLDNIFQTCLTLCLFSCSTLTDTVQLRHVLTCSPIQLCTINGRLNNNQQRSIILALDVIANNSSVQL